MSSSDASFVSSADQNRSPNRCWPIKAKRPNHIGEHRRNIATATIAACNCSNVVPLGMRTPLSVTSIGPSIIVFLLLRDAFLPINRGRFSGRHPIQRREVQREKIIGPSRQFMTSAHPPMCILRADGSRPFVADRTIARCENHGSAFSFAFTLFASSVISLVRDATTVAAESSRPESWPSLAISSLRCDLSAATSLRSSTSTLYWSSYSEASRFSKWPNPLNCCAYQAAEYWSGGSFIIKANRSKVSLVIFRLDIAASGVARDGMRQLRGNNASRPLGTDGRSIHPLRNHTFLRTTGIHVLSLASAESTRHRPSSRRIFRRTRTVPSTRVPLA